MFAMYIFQLVYFIQIANKRTSVYKRLVSIWNTGEIGKLNDIGELGGKHCQSNS